MQVCNKDLSYLILNYSTDCLMSVTVYTEAAEIEDVTPVIFKDL